MKYGYIVYNYGNATNRFAGYNVGDAIQSICLKQLYKQMGLSFDELKSVDFCDLKTYDGEYILLPIIGVAVGITEFGNPPFSPKIIPVFIGSHINSQNFDDKTINYINSYAPIGCRDEYGLKQMQNLGIPAYISGCITMTYNRKASLPENGTIFFVDVPESIKKYIPEEYKKRILSLTHLIPLPNKKMTHHEALEYEEKAEEILTMYAEKASIMVSSRLHAIAPCLAMGIPCIFVTENISYRFSFIDKYLPIYTPDMFDKIDWHPEPVKLEYIKKNLYELFSSVLRDNYNQLKLKYEISDYYENRLKSVYGSRYVSIIKSLNGKLPDEFHYILWGCGLTGESVFNAINKIFPKSELLLAVDEYKEGTFHQHNIVKSSEIEKYPCDIVFLANYSGKDMGYALMKKLNKVEGVDFVYFGTQNG